MPIYGSALLLVAELAYWSLDERIRERAQAGVELPRLVAILAVGVAAIPVSALVLAAADAEGGRRGADAAGESAERNIQVEARDVLVDLASGTRPVGELIGVLIAIVLLTLLFRSGWAMGATHIGALIRVTAGQILLAMLSAPLGCPRSLP